MAALGCGFNRSMQHTRRYRSGRSVADEAKATDLLLRQPEDAHLGALAEGGDASPDRRIKVYFCDPQSPWQRKEVDEGIWIVSFMQYDLGFAVVTHVLGT